jgi:serine/threonine-protein kinase
MPVTVAVGHVLQACEAIAEAHALGIVHRDLKPANLFLTQRADGSPLVKVLDFGISKAAPTEPGANLTRTQTVMGSPAYMSPEQLRSSRDVDARSDIWSLGIVLYELVSGRQPFTGQTFSEICLKVGMDPLPPLAMPYLPPGFAAVVATCLEKDPRQRYQNLAELTAALAQFVPEPSRVSAVRVSRVLNVAPDSIRTVATAAVPASPTTLWSASGQMTAPPARTRRGRLWIGVGLVALAAAAGLAYSMSGSPSGGQVGASGVPDSTARAPATSPAAAAPVSAVAPQPQLADAGVASAAASPDAGAAVADEPSAPPASAPAAASEAAKRRSRDRGAAPGQPSGKAAPARRGRRSTDDDLDLDIRR